MQGSDNAPDSKCQDGNKKLHSFQYLTQIVLFEYINLAMKYSTNYNIKRSNSAH